MTSELKKKYGLILKAKKDEPIIAKPKPAAIFEDDDDDQVAEAATSKVESSASNIRVQRAAQREHEKALAYDPSIFDYDANYDEIQSVKNQKKEEQKEADKKRESKYALAIMKAHKRREIETHSREERMQQKERIKEGEEFADKEVFITGAYRKQMEDVQKYREEEALEDQFNDLTSVSHQKMWQVGIGRTLLNDIAREEPATFLARKKKERHERGRLDSSPSPSREVKKEGVNEPKKKSIYSDDEEDVKPPPKVEVKQQKNFEEELKPGLNLVTKKAVTKAERVRQRNYTPTPPSSDDEGGARKDRRRKENAVGEKKKDDQEENDEEDKTEKEIRDVKEEKKLSLKAKLQPLHANKEQRMNGLKQILRQRNNHEDIEAIRARYLERKAAGIVVPPL